VKRWLKVLLGALLVLALAAGAFVGSVLWFVGQLPH
jgi:hypothetical protein